jgi:hypothetical protein
VLLRKRVIVCPKKPRKTTKTQIINILYVNHINTLFMDLMEGGGGGKYKDTNANDNDNSWVELSTIVCIVCRERDRELYARINIYECLNRCS